VTDDFPPSRNERELWVEAIVADFRLEIERLGADLAITDLHVDLEHANERAAHLEHLLLHEKRFRHLWWARRLKRRRRRPRFIPTASSPGRHFRNPRRGCPRARTR